MPTDPLLLSQITPVVTPVRALDIAQSLDLRAPALEFYANPYPIYAALRSTDPVRLMPDGTILLTRYKDLIQVYKDAQTFSSDKKVEFAPKFAQAPYLLEHHTTSLVFNDPPLHTEVRKIMVGALTRQAIEHMQAGLVTLVTQLCDRIHAKGSGDLIEDFAAAIPIDVIGNLLCIPVADRAPLRRWSLAILGALEPRISPEQAALGNTAVREFQSYLSVLVADRRAHPGDPQTDVLTRLIQGQRSDTRQPLLESELLHNCIFILNAGHETTTNLIGNALVALQEWPAQKKLLIEHIQTAAQNPQQLDDVTNAAVDEFLRFEPSNQLGSRRVTKNCTVGGVPLPAGTLITLCIGAANRDPEIFDRPECLDITRTTLGGGKHLSFGFGIHQCAGLQLARMEGRIALQIFLQCFPDYRLSAAPVRGGRARFRGFLSAPFSL